MQRNVINNNLRSRRRLSQHSVTEGEVCSRFVPQFSHRNRKEFYGNGCVSDGVQKRRYLPHSLAIMTNVRRRQKKSLILANDYASPVRLNVGLLILRRRSARCIAKCADDEGASHRREILRKIERFREKLHAASDDIYDRLIIAAQRKIDAYSRRVSCLLQEYADKRIGDHLGRRPLVPSSANGVSGERSSIPYPAEVSACFFKACRER